MPSLPIYNSNQNINTTPAGVPSNIAAQPFEDVKNMVGTIQDVTKKLSDANDVMQVTKAHTTAGMAMAQLEKQAKLDPNPDNVEPYLKSIQDIPATAISGISNQQVAQKANLEIQQNAFLTGIKVQDMFKQKQMLANDISLGNAADLAAQNKSNAVSEAAGQQIEHDFISTVQSNYSAGLINEGRAKSLIDDYRMGEVKNDILKENVTQIGDSAVLAEVNKGKDGKYPMLSTDQRTEADRMVRLMVRDNHQISTEQSMSTRVDTIKSIANGDLTWQNTNFISQIAQKDPNLAEALQKNFSENKLGKKYSATDDKNSDFESLVGDIFKANTKEDINKYLIKSLVPGMSMDRLSIIVKAAEQRGANLPTLPGSVNGVTDPKQQDIDHAVKHIQTLKNPNILIDFFKNLSGGSSPLQATQNAVNSEAIKVRPDLVGNSSTGKVMVDKYGNRATVFPDGHFEEIKGKSK